jgi:hypothetical protein
VRNRLVAGSANGPEKGSAGPAFQSSRRHAATGSLIIVVFVRGLLLTAGPGHGK